MGERICCFQVVHDEDAFHEFLLPTCRFHLSEIIDNSRDQTATLDSQ